MVKKRRRIERRRKGQNYNKNGGILRYTGEFRGIWDPAPKCGRPREGRGGDIERLLNLLSVLVVGHDVDC